MIERLSYHLLQLSSRQELPQTRLQRFLFQYYSFRAEELSLCKNKFQLQKIRLNFNFLDKKN